MLVDRKTRRQMKAETSKRPLLLTPVGWFAK